MLEKGIWEGFSREFQLLLHRRANPAVLHQLVAIISKKDPPTSLNLQIFPLNQSRGEWLELLSGSGGLTGVVPSAGGFGLVMGVPWEG